MIQAAPTRSTRVPLAPVSFTMGMIAGLPELIHEYAYGDRPGFLLKLHRACVWLVDHAPARGRANDGYDLVADRALVRALARRKAMMRQQWAQYGPDGTEQPR